ncbi:MAG: hypothetical protein IT204_07735 [Fimbriimonadaceae bacterium]|nr:hypothetical protein [Fimbriimonadaceae bacterium]
MAARDYVVLSAIGPDRAGLVASLTASLAAAGGNVEDSRMAVLGGSFGIMMLVSGAPGSLRHLAACTATWEIETGLRVHLEPTAGPSDANATRRYEVEVEAADREGIVSAIAAALYDLGGNIVDLTTTLYPAPISGSPLFRLDLLADVPLAVDLRRIEERFGQLEAEENLDCLVRVQV